MCWSAALVTDSFWIIVRVSTWSIFLFYLSAFKLQMHKAPGYFRRGSHVNYSKTQRLLVPYPGKRRNGFWSRCGSQRSGDGRAAAEVGCCPQPEPDPAAADKQAGRSCPSYCLEPAAKETQSHFTCFFGFLFAQVLFHSFVCTCVVAIFSYTLGLMSCWPGLMAYCIQQAPQCLL